jgi:hypothetical protein
VSREHDARKAVSMDAYSPYQIGRDYNLKAHELAALINMTMTAPWRSMVWTGSLKDLADDTRMSRNTAPKAVAGLEAKGCIVIREPFKQGEFGSGVVELPLYPQMVKLSVTQQQFHSESARDHAEAIAHQSRTNRAANAHQSRTLTRLPDSDQDSRESRGIWQLGNGEVQDFQESEALCRFCDEPVVGHTYSDHEPEAAVAS